MFRQHDSAAAGKRARAIGTTSQIVVVNGRNGLRTGAVEINCAAGDRVRVNARSEGSRNPIVPLPASVRGPEELLVRLL